MLRKFAGRHKYAGTSIILQMATGPNHSAMDAQSLFTVAQVRALERAATESLGVSGYELMHRAARAAYQFLAPALAECAAHRACFVAVATTVATATRSRC